jgi:WD40 repeat protein/serine/threonine protein kinase
MSHDDQNHPDRAQLAAFVAGRLSGPECIAIETHLELCETCVEVLACVPPDRAILVLQAAASSNSVGAGSTAGDASVAVSAMPATQTSAAPDTVSGPEVPPPVLAGHSRYRITGLLGEGGMGAVYKAEHLLMRRPVALKIIRRDLIDRPAAVARFRREVEAAARLAHPNIVTAFDAEQVGETHFLVMEFVEGRNLAQIIAETGPLPVDKACDYVRQVALGLEHAHARGMVHRDIKPQNLMLTPNGSVKILDFGLARFASEAIQAVESVLTESSGSAPRQEPAADAHRTGTADVEGLDAPTEASVTSAHEARTIPPRGGALTAAGAMLGTADYIAPEQVNDPHAADVRADIYSLGCTLYFFLTGRAAFPGGSVIDKVLAHLEQTAAPISRTRADVPPQLDALLARMMDKDPSKRFQTPSDVVAALGEISPAGFAPRPTAGREMPATRLRRRTTWAVVAAALLLACAASVWQVVRILTAEGELVIDAVDPNVAIHVTRDNVRIVDSATQRSINLKVGRYGVVLASDDPELEISANEITIERGKQAIVRIWREKRVASAGEKSETVGRPAWRNPETIGELREFSGHTRLARSVRFAPDGRRVASASWDGTVRIWAVETGETIRVISHTGARSVSWSSDGKRLLSAGMDKLIRHWDVETGDELRRLEGHTVKEVTVEFLSDGRHAVSGGGSGDNSIRLWDLDAGEQIAQADAHSAAVFDVAVSPDGSLIASAGYDHAVRVWRVPGLEPVSTFNGHTAGVAAVAFSPDGTHVLSAGWDNVLRLWDASSAEEVRQFVGHEKFIEDIDFSRNGRRAISASHDGTVRLWDVATGRELRKFVGHDQPVCAVAFHPEARTAISGGHDGKLRLWSLPADLWTPLPLASWTTDRRIRSVAQDGTADFDSIQSAIEAAEPGDVIEVLDRGPYRERVSWPEPPADVAIISRVQTRIELPDWERLPGEPGRARYRGWHLGCNGSLRLFGFEFVCPTPPADASTVTAIDVIGIGFLAVESCRIMMHAPQSPPKQAPGEAFPAETATRLVALAATTPRFSNPPAGLRLAHNWLGGEVALHWPAPFVIEQNVITAGHSPQGLSFAWYRPGDVLVRHNILRGVGGIRFAASTADSAHRADSAGPRVIIANNTIDVVERPFVVERPPAGVQRWLPGHVRIQNNVLLSRQLRDSISFEDPSDSNAVSGLWQVNHNAIAGESGGPSARHAFDADLVVLPVAQFFISNSPRELGYYRPGLDGPLARSAAADDLPRFIGALPPGPVASPTDWFYPLSRIEPMP